MTALHDQLTYRPSRDDIATYLAEGVVCLRGVVTPNWVDHLREATEWALNNPPDTNALEFGREANARFYGELFIWQRIEAFKQFALDSGIADVVAALTDSDTTRLLYDYLLVKEAGGSPATPWHQDWPYYPLRHANVCSTWIAMDHVDASNGGVQYIRGSHRWNKLFRPSSFTADDSFERPELEPMPDIEAHRGDYDIVVYDLEPGDVLVHQTLLVHGAPANDSDQRRRGLAVRWMYGDVEFDPKPKTSEIIERKVRAAGLSAGDVLSGPCFPGRDISGGIPG